MLLQTMSRSATSDGGRASAVGLPNLFEQLISERLPWPPVELLSGGIIAQCHEALRLAEDGKELPEVATL